MRSRWHGAWRLRASWISAAWRVVTSGRSRRNNGWHHCYTWRAQAGGRIEQVVAWAYGQDDARSMAHWIGCSPASAPSRSISTRGPHMTQSARSTPRPIARAARSRRRRQALLRAYRFTRVARSAHGCEITAERLLGSNATLYLIGDAKASKLLRPIFLALLSEVVDAAYELANRRGGRLVLPLLICLDEAGNVAPLPNSRRSLRPRRATTFS